MNPLKIRRLLIQAHLYLAGFLAPVFVLVAITGGLDLAGFDAKTKETQINLSQSARLDFKSTTLQSDIETLLSDSGIEHSFEYVRIRGNSAATRPTSRNYIRFENTEAGLKATLHKPNLQYRLMELHKGHGPSIFRAYQILAAVALFLVVIGGLTVGLLANNYRKPTLMSSIIGTAMFAALAFF